MEQAVPVEEQVVSVENPTAPTEKTTILDESSMNAIPPLVMESTPEGNVLLEPTHLKQYKNEQPTVPSVHGEGSISKKNKIHLDTRRSERLKAKLSTGATKKEPTVLKINPIIQSKIAKEKVPSKGHENLFAKQKPLTKIEALTKYKARLLLLDRSEFSILNNAYVSLYEPKWRKVTELQDNCYPSAWTNILKDVSLLKGVNLLGCLPHYGTIIKGTTLKIYNCRPEIVLSDDEEQYKKLGYTQVEPRRVHLAKDIHSSSKIVSPLLFTAQDRKADELWQAINESVTGKAHSSTLPVENTTQEQTV